MFSFKTTTKILKASIAKILNVVSEKASLPILANLYMRLEDNTLSITGTDLTTYIIDTITVKGSGNGEIVIPARLTANIISSFDGDIEFKQNGDLICIKSGKSEFQIPTENADDFPRFVNLDDMKAIVLTSENIKSLSKVIHSASADELHPEMNCVLMDVDKDNLNFVATSGYTLSHVKDSLTTGQVSDIFQLLLNLTVSNLIVKYATDKEKSYELKYNAENMMLTNGSMVIISRIVNEVYPNYKAVIPKEFKSELTLNRSEFKQAVKRASYINPKTVSFKFAEKILTVFSENPEFNLHYAQAISYTCEVTPNDTAISSEALLKALDEVQPEAKKETISVKIGKVMHLSGQANHFEIITFKMPKEKKKEEPKEKKEKKSKKSEETSDKPAEEETNKAA